MNKKKKTDKRIIVSKIINVMLILSLWIITYFVGVKEAGYMEPFLPHQSFLGFFIFLIAVVLVSLCVLVIIHEAGHMVFGLLTGYRFLSFRVFSFAIVNVDGKLVFKSYKVPGTAGQCLMLPKTKTGDDYPIFWYNMGGSIFTLIFTLLCVAFYLFLPGIAFLTPFFFFSSILGVYITLNNAIPMYIAIPNDGFNALFLNKNKVAKRNLYYNLMMAEAMAKAGRLCNMPDEWFHIYDDEAMKNPIVAVMGVNTCNRLIDQKRFKEADELISHFMEIDASIPNLYKQLLKSERVFIEIIGENRKEVVESLFTPDVKKILKALKNNISALRIAYAIEILHFKNEKKAAMLLKRFEKYSKKHPYSGEVDSEKELISLVSKKLMEQSENN